MGRQFSFEFSDIPAGSAIQGVVATIIAALQSCPDAEVCIAAGAAPGALATTVTTSDDCSPVLMKLACPMSPWRYDEI